VIALKVLVAVLLIGLTAWVADTFYDEDEDAPENDDEVRERVEHQREAGVR
jgi:hypothetical protein